MTSAGSGSAAHGRALITGGAGFIGAHLARRLLADGHAVDLVDNLSRGVDDELIAELRRSDRFAVHVADLRDTRCVEGLGSGYTHIFHFAALLGVQNVIDRPGEVLRDNVAMVQTVLDLGRRQGRLRRLVFPSTSEVYAGTQLHFELPIPSPESAPLAVPPLEQPRTSYMLSKIYGEALVHHAGLPFTIVRPHNVYGPRMGLAHVVPQLLQRIAATPDGGELTVYSIDHRRTMCFVDDAVEHLVRLMDAEAAIGGTFNVGVQSPEVTIGDLAALLCDTVGRRLVLVAGETAPGSPPRRCPDMTRTIAVTGHQPAVGLAEGVARTYRWYAENVFSGRQLSAL
jgi:nucleoside-diphosphate-sugar epimerase